MYKKMLFLILCVGCCPCFIAGADQEEEIKLKDEEDKTIQQLNNITPLHVGRWKSARVIGYREDGFCLVKDLMANRLMTLKEACEHIKRVLK